MADIRAFFSPKGGHKQQSDTTSRRNGTKKDTKSSVDHGSKHPKHKSTKKEGNKKAKKRIVILESDDEETVDFKKKITKKIKKSDNSDSDEEPLPEELRKNMSKKKSKKSTYFDESDDEDPVKLKKSSSSKPSQAQSSTDKKSKPVTPKKQTVSANDFFGSAPVSRSTGKPTKRKQPSEDTTPEKSSSSSSSCKRFALDSQPSKKRKEEKSPGKKETTLSSKLAKAAATKTFVPDTPSPSKLDKKEKHRKTPSPTKPESTKKKADTPQKQANQADDVIPPSLEKKKSGYRSFMQREGPRALGSKEIPEGAENCFEGMTFVITGVLDAIERDQAQDIIQRYGGKVTSAVSKKTSYLIAGRDPGASKTSKANSLGTKTIDEDGFLDLIKNTPGKKSSNEPTPKKPTGKKSKTLKMEVPAPKPSPSKLSTSKSSVSPASPSTSRASLSQSSMITDSQNSLSSPLTQTPSGSPMVKEESLMWVDKYKPNTIKQIIGQQGEKSNMRKLINWVRNWAKNRTKTHPKTSFFQKDQDGAIHKAALLSGPPGVGKTTTAVLVCKELGYSYVEMNASDSRNKKTLEQYVSLLLSNKSMDAYVGGSKSAIQDASKHILIMDEVDGMAGNEDRGGMQELISLIKGSKIPIICMCNDRNSQKIRSLVNYCFDLRFQRPRVEQIKGAMMSIAYKEGLKIPAPAMDQIILGANQDIRQVLHNLSMWSSTNKQLTYDTAKQDAAKAHKDIKMGPFDAIRKLLSFESQKLSVIDKSDLFFSDYSLMPLFVQENYLSVRPSKSQGDIKKCLDLVSKTADSICDGDLVERLIRSNNNWSLLPMQAMFSSVIPSYFISGGMDQRIDFPQWLGKNSKRGRLDRILQELQTHMRLSTSADKACVNLDYVPHLRNCLTKPLMDEANSKEGVSSVINLLGAYDLTREDWDSVMEVGHFEGHKDPMSRVPSKVKAAFTRTYNKEHHKTPYVLKAPPSKGRGKATQDAMGFDEEQEDEEDDDSLENSAMLVKTKKPAAKTTKHNKGKITKGKGKNLK